VIVNHLSLIVVSIIMKFDSSSIFHELESTILLIPSESLPLIVGSAMSVESLQVISLVWLAVSLVLTDRPSSLNILDGQAVLIEVPFLSVSSGSSLDNDLSSTTSMLEIKNLSRFDR